MTTRLPMVFRRTDARGANVGAAGAPDVRGNNPHGTRESSDAEGRRRNAGRYETVGELDRALDQRLRPRQALGDASPIAAPSSGIVGLLLLGVAAAVIYTLAKNNDDDVDDEIDELEGRPASRGALRQNPEPAAVAPQLGVPVMLFMQPPGAQAPWSVAGTTTTGGAPSTAVHVHAPAASSPASVDVPQPVQDSPAVVVVTAPAPEEKPKRRRALGPNRGQFTTRTAKKARALVQHPGPAPKAV